MPAPDRISEEAVLDAIRALESGTSGQISDYLKVGATTIKKRLKTLLDGGLVERTTDGIYTLKDPTITFDGWHIEKFPDGLEVKVDPLKTVYRDDGCTLKYSPGDEDTPEENRWIIKYRPNGIVSVIFPNKTFVEYHPNGHMYLYWADQIWLKNEDGLTRQYETPDGVVTEHKPSINSGFVVRILDISQRNAEPKFLDVKGGSLDE